MSEIVFIYGLKIDGRFLYVGQSVQPEVRRRCLTSKHFFLRGAKLVIIRRCQEGSAARIEHQVIRALKRRGQCQVNIKTHQMSFRRVPGRVANWKVTCTKTGLEWPTLAAAARHFKLNGMTLRNNLLRGFNRFRSGNRRHILKLEALR